MPNDFIDGDFLKPTPNEQPQRPVSGGGGATLYERLRNRVEDDESRTSDELERIRKRSEEVERQRQALRSLRGKQTEFDRTYRELTERLKRHIVLLRTEEEQASRAATVCHETRHRFEGLAAELERIDPNSWSEETLDNDLTQALAQIESANAVFRKGADRVAAIGWRPDETKPARNDGLLADVVETPRRFGEWLRIGFALTLPLTLLLLLLTIAALWITNH